MGSSCGLDLGAWDRVVSILVSWSKLMVLWTRRCHRPVFAVMFVGAMSFTFLMDNNLFLICSIVSTVTPRSTWNVWFARYSCCSIKALPYTSSSSVPAFGNVMSTNDVFFVSWSHSTSLTIFLKRYLNLCEDDSPVALVFHLWGALLFDGVHCGFTCSTVTFGMLFPSQCFRSLSAAIHWVT